MKKNYAWAFIAAVLMFAGTLQSYAEQYTISFTGSGKSATVGSVEVQNLTQGTTVTVPGGEVLVLNVVLTALNPLQSVNDGINVSSTLVAGRSNVSFFAKQAGNTQISVYAMDGRKIASTSGNLQKGYNSFEVSLPTGAYVINVRGTSFNYSAKLISVGSSNSRAEIAFTGFKEGKTSGPLKSAEASTALDYHPGDIMLYKGISGNYATIVTDKPTGSKTVNFEFIECKDASGNYYATVRIGNQVWMAENLKTAKYNDGTTIPNITVNTEWGNTALVTGAWCNLNHDAANGTKFGKLYNWFAVNDSRGIAPAGFHVPTIAEYDTLTYVLGGDSLAGIRMKETGLNYWPALSVPPATNESGFSARAGAKCNSSGNMNDFEYCYLWTATEISGTNATCAYLTAGSTYLVNSYSPGKRNGFSLRCVMDDHTVKSISFYAGWAGGTEMWDFTYDPMTHKVSKFDNFWDGDPDKTIVYDYSEPGKLRMWQDETTLYGDNDLNDQGYVIKDKEGNTFEYDADGFLVKYYEYWGDASHLKYVSTITNGNVTRITTYDDDGVTVKRIKEYTYTSKDNTEGLHQANAIDSEWKPVGNLYGKPCAKLVDYLEYWDPRVTPVVKNKSTYAYTFDSKNRIQQTVKTLQDSSTEEWSYTYHD